MPQDDQVLVLLGIDAKEYTSELRKVRRAAQSTDQALLNLVDSANRAEKALNAISGGATAKVKIDDSEISGAVRLVEDLDTTVQTKITADASDIESSLSEIENDLDRLADLATIDVALNIAGGLADINPLDLPGVSTIVETDKAVRNLNARVFGEIPNAGAIIDEVYTAAFGDTRDEVAEAVAAVIQLGVNSEDAAATTAGAFTVAEIAGEDFNAVLEAADALVKNDLAPDFDAAFDIITAGIQGGLNKNQDLLDSFGEYSSIFADLGVDAEAFLSIIAQGLEAGAKDSDKIVDTYKELGLRVRDGFSQSLTDEGGAQADILEKLEFLDEAAAFEAGELSGEEMFAGLRTAIERGLAEGTITQQDVFDLGGGAIEDLTIPIFLEIDPLQVDEEFSQIEGRTIEAGVELFGDIDTAITEAQRVIEGEFARTLDEAFDIKGKIEEFTSGVQTFAGLVRGGEGIPEAVEQAFAIEGFADFFRNIETVLGDILIGILEIVAGVMDVAGNTEGAAAVRETIADQASRQLAFDLKFAANEDELRGAIANAMRRGVDEVSIGETLEGTVQELIDTGNLEEARTLLSQIEASSGKIFGAEIDETALAFAENVRAQQANIFASPPQELIDMADRIEQAQLLAENFDASNLEDQIGAVDAAQETFDTLGAIFEPIGEGFTIFQEGLTSQAENISTTADNVTSDFNALKSGIGSALGTAQTKIQEFADGALPHLDAIEDSAEGIFNIFLAIAGFGLPAMPDLGGGVGAMPTDSPAASGGKRQGAFTVGEQGREMVFADSEVAILNNQTTSTLMSAVDAAFRGIAAGGGDNVANDNRSQSQVNNIMIQSDADGFRQTAQIANQIRGFR